MRLLTASEQSADHIKAGDVPSGPPFLAMINSHRDISWLLICCRVSTSQLLVLISCGAIHSYKMLSNQVFELSQLNQHNQIKC